MKFLLCASVRDKTELKIKYKTMKNVNYKHKIYKITDKKKKNTTMYDANVYIYILW